MKYIYNDTDKNKHEALDKAEVLAAIQQIIEEGEIPSTLMNGVALTLRNPIDNVDYKIAFCTQAQYNALVSGGTLETNCYYFITDDTSYDDMVNEIDEAIQEMQEDVALLPRTQELMQEASSDSTSSLDIYLNDMNDINNYVEITGYVYADANGNKYYFTHRVNAYLNVAGSIPRPTPRGRSLVFLSSGADIDDGELAMVTTYVMKTSHNGSMVYKLSASVENISQSSSATYTFNITSVKELINY